MAAGCCMGMRGHASAGAGQETRGNSRDRAVLRGAEKEGFQRSGRQPSYLIREILRQV